MSLSDNGTGEAGFLLQQITKEQIFDVPQLQQ